MTFWVEPELRIAFIRAALLEDRPAVQILREFMRAYVRQVCEPNHLPANDAISADERRRREEAASFALACVGFEGFKPSNAVLEQTRRHVNGEIPFSELVQ